MKRTYILLIALILITLLSGCECKHQWIEADCLTPKTCEKCQVTEGEALGHSWQEAACETAKTCTACGETEGEALGHEWQEATCDTARICTVCGAAEGKPLGHAWQEATCLAPKTCAACGQTEGETGKHPVDRIVWYPVWESGEPEDVEKMCGRCICGTWIESGIDWETVTNSLMLGHWEIDSFMDGSFSQSTDLAEYECYLDVFPDGTATLVLLEETTAFTWSFTQIEGAKRSVWYELVAEDGSKAEMSFFIIKNIWLPNESHLDHGMIILDRWFLLGMSRQS
ncbi:MAG: hypothetical protein IJA75_00275 [Oscillospiraceae bacterium]|nr:hypothetical protein [Oscillospiraceae bacterium]